MHMNKLLKEPLLHFLVLGLALFVLFELVAEEEGSAGGKTITVDRDALLTFIQFRTRAFEPSIAAQRLDGLSDQELELLVDDYVREEALYREALALGMDRNDYVIKRRMIQSVEFITKGFVTRAVEVSDDDVKAHYEANRKDYYIEPFVTFTHVFFSNEGRTEAEIDALAAAELNALNTRRVPFSAAPGRGERFPYFVNYVERDPEFVASHFGSAMAEAIFSLEPDELAWKGPYLSPYGTHLVLLTRKAPGRFPELSEIESSVRQDAERAALQKANEAAIQAIVDTYEVERQPEPRQRAGAG
jgi:hypothetical protein